MFLLAALLDPTFTLGGLAATGAAENAGVLDRSPPAQKYAAMGGGRGFGAPAPAMAMAAPAAPMRMPGFSAGQRRVLGMG